MPPRGHTHTITRAIFCRQAMAGDENFIQTRRMVRTVFQSAPFINQSLPVSQQCNGYPFESSTVVMAVGHSNTAVLTDTTVCPLK